MTYQEALNNINELMCSECHPNKEFCHSECQFPKCCYTLQELIDNYEKVEKALDKACKVLEDTEYYNPYVTGLSNIHELTWKEYLLKEYEEA